MTEAFNLGGIIAAVNDNCKFGTDAVLLAEFAAPHRNDTVCDLCSGCGIIPLLLSAKQPPKLCYGVEIQHEAVELFRQSVAQNELSERVVPVECDLRELALGDNSPIPRESVNLVTANPPYFPDKSGLERLTREQAIARHEIMCSFDDVAAAAARLLKYGGLFRLCHIPSRMTDVFVALRKYGLEPKTLTLVSSREGAEPWLMLVSAKKGAKCGLRISSIIRTAQITGSII